MAAVCLGASSNAASPYSNHTVVWPISEAKRPIARINICGYDWDVFFGYNHAGAMKVYSFLPVHGAIPQFTADVKYFFDYLTHEHRFPAHEQYMLSRCPSRLDHPWMLTGHSLPVRNRGLHGRPCELHRTTVHRGCKDMRVGFSFRIPYELSSNATGCPPDSNCRYLDLNSLARIPDFGRNNLSWQNNETSTFRDIYHRILALAVLQHGSPQICQIR